MTTTKRRGRGNHRTARATVIGLGAVVSVVMVAGCGSEEGSTVEADTSSPVAVTLTISQACASVDTIMESVSDVPDQQTAQQLAGQLAELAAKSPKEVGGRISDLATATTTAASVPQGFLEGSPTEQQFVLAAQELTIVCQPDGPDVDPTRSAPSDEPEVVTP